MHPKVSILLPSIRPQNLSLYFEALKKACEYNEFQLVIVSPYINYPENVLKDSRVTFLHSYANPNVCLAQAASLAKSDFLYNNTDDGLIQENALDIAIEFFENKVGNRLRDIDIVNMQYVEDVLNLDLTPKKEPTAFHPNYWATFCNPDFNKPAINPNWRIAPHFFMRRNYFEKLGGLDMRFHYNNYSLHDLVFRAQYNGSKVYDFPFPAFFCSHLPGITGDHESVNNAQIYHDKPLWDELYDKEDSISNRVFLNLNDWKKEEKVWKERFPDTNVLPLVK